MSFENDAYSVDEAAGMVQIVLLLSDSLAIDITIQVLNINGLATGKYKTSLKTY